VTMWHEEFTRLSDIHGQEWQKFVHGENNQQAVCNSMDDVAEILRRWEAAGCPDREEEIYIQQIGPSMTRPVGDNPCPDSLRATPN